MVKKSEEDKKIVEYRKRRSHHKRAAIFSESDSKVEGKTLQVAAVTWQEEGRWIAQCLQVDVASQGETEEEALTNLKEALELHFEPPVATILPGVHTLEIELAAA